MSSGHAEGLPASLEAPERFTVELLERPPASARHEPPTLDEPELRRRAPQAPSESAVDLAGPAPGTHTDLAHSAELQTLPLKVDSKVPHTDAAMAYPPRTLVSFLGTAVLPKNQTGNGSTVNEPSVAHGGKHVIYSGNWYVARSGDGGLTWSFIDPFADMRDFCCDQDVIYDRGRDLFLWYRQGVADETGTNRALLAASTDGGVTWCKYTLTPGMLQGHAGHAFDYPALALSDNFLYIHTGFRGRSTTAVMRLPLDPLASCAPLPQFWWWGQVSGWGGPAQGATTAMYFGDHQGASNSFRIYQQLESNAGITWNDVPIPGWRLEEGEPAGACPAKDGGNWCARSDSHVRAGWVGNGQIGFMWHATNGNGFPYPYVEAATFSERDFSQVGRPLIWSNTGAWHYPFASPNARGDVAVTAFFSDPASFPSPYFLLHDDYSSSPPPWEAYRLFTGSASANWGDYVRNRAFQPSQLGWVTSAWIARPTEGGGPEAVPLYYILGRQRDLPSIGRYWQA